MSLKKLCRCGKLIDYSERYCEECCKKVAIDKTESNRFYDKNVRQLRDKKYTGFYKSKEWIRTVEIVKSKYKYMDIYSYYVLGRIEYGNICHHITPIKTNDGWDNKLDINGLMYLTHSNHATVHKMLDEDLQGTIRLMTELVIRWNKEFGINSAQ